MGFALRQFQLAKGELFPGSDHQRERTEAKENVGRGLWNRFRVYSCCCKSKVRILKIVEHTVR